MKWIKGNIWVYHKLKRIIVIPTNVGWKANGDAIMGAGLAKEIPVLYPHIVKSYGAKCKSAEIYVYYPNERLILVPSKPLDKNQPWLSWKQEADYRTVEKSLKWLEQNAEEFNGTVYVPLIGCGNGRLEKGLVKGIMDKELKSDIFVGVDW